MPKILKLTREKHLDHMVRVVPLVVFGFIIQSYLIMSIDPNEFGKNMVLLLAFSLGTLIAGLSIYDVTHHVTLLEDHLLIEMKWLGKQTKVNFSEIKDIHCRHPDQNFTTVDIILYDNTKYVFYFVDSPVMIKEWIKSHSHQDYSQAA